MAVKAEWLLEKVAAQEEFSCVAAREKAMPPRNKGARLREALLSLEYRWESKVLTTLYWDHWCNKGLKALL